MEIRYGDYQGLNAPNDEEKAIIEEVAKDIESKYHIKISKTIGCEVYEARTQKWSFWICKNAKICCMGENAPLPPSIRQIDGVVRLTRCEDKKAFHEVVFHEFMELLSNDLPVKFSDDIEKKQKEIGWLQREYVASKFPLEHLKLDNREWSPMEKELLRIVHPLGKETLERTFEKAVPISRKWEEIEERINILELKRKT